MKNNAGMVIGLIVIVTGIAAGILALFLSPDVVVKFGFQLGLTVVIVLLALIISVPLILAGYFFTRIRRENQLVHKRRSDALEEERRQFIRRLDHELKNPLTAMQIQLDNLPETTPALSKPVAEIREQVNRLSALTRGLRSLADLETRPLSLELIDVEELLTDVVALLDASDRIRLHIQKTPWPPQPIEGDRELLLMAFRNLGQNGLNYSEGVVEISARQISNHLRVEVIDTGRGICAEDLPHLTEELFRGENVREFPGSGLGLSIASRIIERHDGILEITSRPDEGTIAAIVMDSLER